MDLNELGNEIAPRKTDWMSVLQLGFSLGLLFLSVLIALFSFLGSSSGLIEPVANGAGSSVSSMFKVFAWTGIMVASVALCSAILAARKAAHKPLPAWTAAKMQWLYFLIILLPVLLAIGLQIFKIPKFAERWMPIFSVIGIFAAGIWYLRLGLGREWGSAAQRNAGLFSFSFGFTTWLILIVELIVLAFFGIIFFVAILSDAQMQALYQHLSEMQPGLQPGSEMFENILSELLQNPAVAGFLLLMISVLMPTVEELLKPFGVLLLRGRDLTPKDGMIAGIFSGAGFGMLEGMLFTVQVPPDTEPKAWALFLAGRSAALVLHILNAALNGWALWNYWQDRKFGKLLRVFLLSVLIHGAWNLISVLAMLGRIAEGQTVWLYGILFLIIFAGYLLFTKKTRAIMPLMESVHET